MGRRKPPPDTLAALAEAGGVFYIQCEACNHYVRLDCYKLACDLSWGVPLKEIERRHKCTRCGHRKASIRKR